MRLVLAAALVVAHFTATSVSGSATHTCGTVTATSATYSAAGTTIVAHSTIDSRTGQGIVTGTLKTGSMDTQFSAVYDHGTIDGLAWGHMRSRTIVSSLSATFSATDGFTHGVLGGRSAGGSVVLDSGCGAPPQRVVRQARGIIKLANADQITVGGLTCVVPSSLGIKITFDYPKGSWATITCSASNGQTTLVTIRGRK